MKNGEEIQAFLIDIQEQKTFDQEYLIVLFSNVSVIFKEKHECTLLSEHLLQSKRTCSESLVCDIVSTKRWSVCTQLEKNVLGASILPMFLSLCF